MAKERKISITEFENVVKENFKDEYVSVEWNGLDIRVKRTLSMAEMIAFVAEISSCCFDEDTGEFTPEIRDFVTKIKIIENYTNINLPQNINHKYDLIYESDIVEAIMPYINKAQFIEMQRSIDAKIKLVSDAHVGEVKRGIDKLIDSLSEMKEHFGELIAGVTPEQFSGFLNTVNELSKESIAEDNKADKE